MSFAESSAPSHQAPEVDVKNGPILIGFTIDCMLFGLLIAQLCVYVRGHKWHRDGAVMQGLVYILCLIELFRVIVVVQSVWGLFIVRRSLPGRFAASTPLAVALPSLAGFESAIVQLFFAWRVWSMRRDCHYWAAAAAVIALIAIIQTAGSIGLSYQLSKLVAHAPHAGQVASLFTAIWLSGSFVCDLFIVITMSLILIGVRKDATFRDTERLINCLLRLTVETGALTALAAAVMLGLHVRYPKDSYSFGILYILGGLYTNILLYLLNSRQQSREPVPHNETRVSLNLASATQITRTSSSISDALEESIPGRSSKD